MANVKPPGFARAALYWALVFGTALIAPARAAEEPPLPPPAIEIAAERPSPDRPARSFRAPYAGEIVDVLTHVSPPRSSGKGRTQEPVAELIRDAGVALAYLMPTPNEGMNAKRDDGTAQKIALARRVGDPVRVFCGGDYLTAGIDSAQRANFRDDDISSLLRRLEGELDGGACRGIGEFGVMHFDKSGAQNVVHLRPNFAPVLDVLALAARKRAWIDVHMEPVEPEGTSHEAEAFGALALWFGRYPDLRLMLSHTAMTSAENARRLLVAYPNLMLPIKLVPRNAGWSHLGPVVNRRGQLYEDWARLMEDMPDRFLVGSDTKFAAERHGSGDKYPETIALFRDVLGSLSPSAADAIAHGNARRILGD
ncbi:MAG: amidohydrolase family protein [Gemmatimonas sp.]